MNDESLRLALNQPKQKIISFEKNITDMGVFSLRPMNIEEDIFFVHDWVNRDYAKFWGMLNTSMEEVRVAYTKICSYSEVFIGCFNDCPSFLMEMYDVSTDPLNEYYEYEFGDYGMHVLVAPAEKRISNFTWNIFTVIIEFMFGLSAVKRIVVEPDIRNEKIHVLNRRAGFQYQKVIQLPQKTAHLAFCTRENYYAAIQKQPS